MTTTRIITHNGIFHADEVFACAILKMALEREVEIIRTRNLDLFQPYDILVDVGGRYDPNLYEYDHHQRGFNVTHEHPYQSVKMASAGLIWKDYGHGVIAQRMGLNSFQDMDDVEEVYNAVMFGLILTVDATDNGQLMGSITVDEQTTVKPFTISHAISTLNALGEAGFDVALQMATQVLEAHIQGEIKKARGAAKVREAYAQAKNGIMVLEEFTRWFEILDKLNRDQQVKLVVFPDITGDWRCQTVKGPNKKDLHPLPEAWAGLDSDDLALVTGLPDVTFCHRGRFICGAKSYHTAMKMAQMALAESH